MLLKSCQNTGICKHIQYPVVSELLLERPIRAVLEKLMRKTFNTEKETVCTMSINSIY